MAGPLNKCPYRGKCSHEGLACATCDHNNAARLDYYIPKKREPVQGKNH
jgi:hypothetical protein